jgi:hypothetical protein
LDEADAPERAYRGGRSILTTFIRSGARAGHVLPEGRLLRAFLKAPWSEADFAPGLDFAMQQGWIERTSHGDYRLTKAGFAAA